MFNDFNPETNGELFFINKIKNEIDVVFDVGAAESIYLNTEKEIHYFEPVPLFLNQLKDTKNKNKKSVFNNFGLSDNEETLDYYTTFQSFVNRSIDRKDSPKIQLSVKKGINYMLENNIKKIGLLKIDTEGFELNVLKGFDDKLKNIKYIQFEYGGTYKDNNIKLIDVVNYLKNFGFDGFSYLSNENFVPILDFEDHYQFSNIICKNNNI